MRSSPNGFPASILVLFGTLVAATGTAAYSFELAGLSVPTPGEVAWLVPISEVYLLVLVVGVALVLYGIRQGIIERVSQIKEKGVAPLSPGWIVPHILSVRRYRRYFVGSALVYGTFYALITSVIVYQPTVDFVQAYGALFPSAEVVPVFAPPLSSPVLTVYIVNHLGLFVIPLTFLLLVATSVLVGLNFALAVFALDSRARGTGKGWVGGIGAIVGLFTGCPTCAGLFFANFLGGAGAVSFVTLLGYYQPAFILLSIPILLVAPFLTSRSLARVYREGCVYLNQKPLA